MPFLRLPITDRSVRGGSGGRIQFVGGAPGSSGKPGLGGGRGTDRSGLLLCVVLGVGIGLGILHNKWRVQRRTDPVLAGVRALTYPFQRGGSVMEAGLFTGWDIVFRGRAIEAENANLRATVDSLRAENESLKSKAADADRLRSALHFVQEQKKPPLAAPIIALLPSPHFDSLTVARGTRDGVSSVDRPSIARTSDGLIGQVTYADAMTSEIMLLTDTNSEVSALVRRKGVNLGIVGIVEGQGRGHALRLKDLKRDDNVQEGDEVVSSGYGGVFPPDIPIGTIGAPSGKSDESALFLKSVVVKPAAAMPGDLREVYLLRP